MASLESPEANPMTFAERIKTPDEDGRMEYFLISLGMQQYIEVFRDNQIRYEDLKLLQKDDLVDMGIPIGPRNRFLYSVQDISAEHYYEQPPEIPAPYQQVEYNHTPEPVPVLPAEDDNIDSLNRILSSISAQQEKMMESINENFNAIENLRETNSLADSSSFFNQSRNYTPERSFGVAMRPAAKKSRLHEDTLSSMAKRKAKRNKFLRVSPARIDYNQRALRE